LADPKKVYWDSCVWISLINREVGRVERCESLIAQAKKGDYEIWTSSFTLAEVFKVVRNGEVIAELPQPNDAAFEQFIEQEFVVEVQVDHEVGRLARHLLRTLAALRKPADAIHLATAAVSNVSELHTFDDRNILPLNGAVTRADGVPLIICPLPPPVLVQQNDWVEPSAPET
jgi:predicted nucleic acid-binding protein